MGQSTWGLRPEEAEGKENVSSAMVGLGVGAPGSRGPACSTKLLCHKKCRGCQLHVCAGGQRSHQLLVPLLVRL